MGLTGVEIPSGGGPLVYVDNLDVPALSDGDHHHLARVRRLRDGDELIIGDGAGNWRHARHSGAEPEPDGEINSVQRVAPAVEVAFALVKGSKPELVVQKLTELGVDRITMFTAERSVVRWDESKAVTARDRLEKVATEAAMQSRQAWLPAVAQVQRFADVVARSGVALAGRGGDPPTLSNPCIMIGPEGGWTEAEEVAAQSTVALARGVLRAETAAIVAGALLVALRAGTVSAGRS